MRTRFFTEHARRYRSEQGGIAAVEFALVMPILFLLLLGGTEMARFILVHIKAEKMAYSVADVISQYESVTGGDVAMVFDATADLMSPYDAFGANGLVILSSVRKEPDEDDQEVHWQCAGGGSATVASHVGEVDDPATLPGEMKLEDNDNVVVSEVFYTYTPIINWIDIQGVQIYKSAMFRPRLGALTAVPGC